MKNIVLIGMPGSGKTTVGEALSRLTGREAVDLDQMIAAEKRSVTHFLKEAAANAPRPAPNKKTKEQPQR